jgi:hypothetical protein
MIQPAKQGSGLVGEEMERKSCREAFCYEFRTFTGNSQRESSGPIGP